MKSKSLSRTLINRVTDRLSPVSSRDRTETHRPAKRDLVIEALEPRILFSGSPAPAPAAEPAPEAAPAAQEAASPAPQEAPVQAAAEAAPVAAPPSPAPSEEAAPSSPPSGAGQGVEVIILSDTELTALADAASQIWSDSGISPDQSAALAGASYQIADLSGISADALGSVEGNLITIDDDAAGRGWFVDSTPEENGSFALSSGDADAASSGVDLLTALIHEQGHVLGLLDDYGDSSNIMFGYLDTGERRLPEAGEAAGAVPGSHDGIQFLTFGPFTEDFEGGPAGTTFTSNDGTDDGPEFTLDGDLAIFNGGGLGSGGTDWFIDTSGNSNPSGVIGSIEIAAGSSFVVESIDAWASDDGGNNLFVGDIIFRGTPAAGGAALEETIEVNSGQDYDTITFSGALAGASITDLEFEIPSGSDIDYLALDDFRYTTDDSSGGGGGGGTTVLFRDDFDQTDATFNQNVEDNTSLSGGVIGSMPQAGATYSTFGILGGEDGNAVISVGSGNNSAFIPNYDFATNADIIAAGAFTVTLEDVDPTGGTNWLALGVFDKATLDGQNITDTDLPLGALFRGETTTGIDGGIVVWSEGGSGGGEIPFTTSGDPFDVAFEITNISGFGANNSFDYRIVVDGTEAQSGTITGVDTSTNYITLETWRGTSTVGALEVSAPSSGTFNAVDDDYTGTNPITEDETLTITAPGVLANDSGVVTADPPALITGVSIEDVSSENGGFRRFAIHSIDGSGLTGNEHNSGATDVAWMANGNTATITYDLEANYDLDSFHVWNYNESAAGNTDRGANLVEILVSDSVGGSFTSLGDFTFAEATGLDSYTGEDVDISAFGAADDTRLIQFVIKSNYGDADQVGLSEIQFTGGAVSTDGAKISSFDTISANGATVSVTPSGGFTYDPTGSASLQALNNGQSVTDTFTYTISEEAPQITGVTIEDVSSENGGFRRYAIHSIDGSGLTGNEHNSGATDVAWMANGNTATITYDLEANYDLDSFHVWNYNESAAGNTDRGANLVEILVTDTVGGSFTSLGDFTFAEAIGTDTYTGEDIDLSTFGAADDTRLIRFVIKSNYGDPDQVGLSEVQFFEAPPSDTATVSILVNGVNDGPAADAVDDDYSASNPITEDETLTITTPGVLANDIPVAPSFSAGAGSSLAGATNLDTANGTRLNIDGANTVTLDAGTYDVSSISFNVDAGGGSGYVRPFLAIETGINEYQTIWVGDQFNVVTTGETSVSYGGESFTLDATSEIFTGIYHTGGARVFYAGGGNTDHDGSAAEPTAAGETVAGISNPDLGRTYAFGVDLVERIHTILASDATSANGAAVTVNPDGSFTYDPTSSPAIQALNDGDTLTDTFTYTITDGSFDPLSFVAISDDANSGVSSSNTYTHAIDFGTSGAATVNGVTFSTDIGSAAGGIANSGTRTYGPNLNPGNTPPAVSGSIADVFQDMHYNGPDRGYIELTDLEAGQWYDLRLYDRAWDYESAVRTYTLEYNVGSDSTVEFTTEKIDQNRATLNPPGLSGNVSWATSYLYQADASGTIRVTIDTADDSTGTYHLYGLTNEAVAAPPSDTATVSVLVNGVTDILPVDAVDDNYVPGAAVTVVNGDFEADSFPTYPGYIGGGSNPSAITGWTYNQTSGGAGINPVAAPDGRAPFRNNGDNDTQVAFIQGVGSLSQTITGLTPGADYVLTFDYNERANGGSTTVSATIAGETFTDANNSPVGGSNPYHQASLTFTATAASELLTLSSATNSGDQTGLFDNVSIVPVVTFQVNEDAAATLPAPGVLENDLRIPTPAGSAGAGSAIAGATGLDNQAGGRNNIDRANTVTLDAGTYSVGSVNFKATGVAGSGFIRPFLLASTGSGTYETLWVGDRIDVAADGEDSITSPEGTFTLNATTEVFSGMYHDGIDRVYYAGGGSTDHDGTPTEPTAAGQTVSGISNPNLGRSYAFGIDIEEALISLVTSDATSAKGAAVTVNPDGSFTYDPTGAADLQALALGENTTDTFTYTISDGSITSPLSFIQITNDADSEIDSSKTYTHAIDFGNNAPVTVNGVAFTQDIVTGTGVRTYGSSVTNPGNNPPNVSGSIADVFRDMRWNGPDGGSIELTGLTAGQWYDLRLYDRAWDYNGAIRTYDVEYDVGSDGTVEFTTDKIDQNRPALGNVSYATSYLYQADASGTIEVTIDLADDFTGTYHLYGLTNEAISAPLDKATVTVQVDGVNDAPTIQPEAGISYRPITGDADSGIDSNKTYTHAIDFGSQPGHSPRSTINGVEFADGSPGNFPGLVYGSSSHTVGTGSTANPNGNAANTAADAVLIDGGVEDLVGDFIYNDPTTEITLTGLTPGEAYRFTLYHRQWGGERDQDISFDVGNDGTIEHTGRFDPDDATEPDVNLDIANRVFALDYDYVLGAGQTSLKINIDQTGDGTYHLYGLSNEVISGVSELSGEITETADNSDPTDVTGTIIFDDVDLIDTHTASVLTASVTGGTASLTSAQQSALLDNLSLTVLEDTPANGSGEVNWIYDVPNSEIDFLAAGETVELTHTVAVGDGMTVANADFEADAYTVSPGYTRDNGGVVTGWAHSGAGVGINPGASSPFRNNGDNSTQVAFIQGVGSLSQTISGLTVGQTYALTFDYNERATGGSTTVTATIAGETFTDAANSPVGGSNPYREAILKFTATSTSETLTISSAPNSGDQATLIDNVQITAVEDVVITITGANDILVIDSPPQTGTITETADNSDPADATGTITFQDPDLSDVPMAEILPGSSVTGGTATLTTAQKNALLDNLSLGTVSDNPDGSGSVGWTYDVPNSEIDFLAAGETVEVTQTVGVSDDNVVVHADSLSGNLPSSSAVSNILATVTNSDIGTNRTLVLEYVASRTEASGGDSWFGVGVNPAGYFGVTAADVGWLIRTVAAPNTGAHQMFDDGTNVGGVASTDASTTTRVTATITLSAGGIATGETAEIEVKFDDGDDGTVNSTLSHAFTINENQLAFGVASQAKAHQYSEFSLSSVNDTQDVVVTITSTNDAPVLDNGVTSDMNDVSVSDMTNDGDLVSDLYNGGISDVDDQSVEGIAITGAALDTPAVGKFQYQKTGESLWNDIGAVADSNALLLLPTDRVRFVPDGMNQSGGTLSYRAWDQTGTTSGQEHTKADASTNGDATPFSTATAMATASIYNLVIDGDDIIYTAVDGDVNDIRVSIDPVTGELLIVDAEGHAVTTGEADSDPSGNGIGIAYSGQNLIIETNSEDDIIRFGNMGAFTGSITADGGADFDQIESFKTEVTLGATSSIEMDAEQIKLMLSSFSAGGNIDLDGTDPLDNSGGTGTYDGLWLYGTDLETTVAGSTITLSGQGGGTGTNNSGIKLTNGSDVTTADGDIDIDGTGGGDALYGTGVALHHGASVSAGGDGGITIDGTGGTGTGLGEGVFFGADTGASVADGDLTITGTATGDGSQNQGVDFTGATLEATGTGNITVTGSGSGSGTNNIGVSTTATDIATTTGTVTLTGTGGTGTSNNQGVRLASTDVTTAGGSIDIDGQGNGTGSGVYNTGVQLAGTTLEVAAGAGTIDIDGTAGDGTALNDGVQITAGSAVTTETGAIGIRGTGMGAFTGNRGANLIASTVGSTSGDITILGTGSESSTAVLNDGVSLSNSHATTAGTLKIAGTGGTGSLLNNGVKVVGGSLSGTLDIDGIGGGDSATGSSNAGVYILNSDLSGALAGSAVDGTGGVGSGLNLGAYLQGTMWGNLIPDNVTTYPLDDDTEKGGNFFPSILPLALMAGAERSANAAARRDDKSRARNERILRNLLDQICDQGTLNTRADEVAIYRNIDGAIQLEPRVIHRGDLEINGIGLPDPSTSDCHTLLITGEEHEPLTGLIISIGEEGKVTDWQPLWVEKDSTQDTTVGEFLANLRAEAESNLTPWSQPETSFVSSGNLPRVLSRALGSDW